jgi:hypothetical protein
MSDIHLWERLTPEQKELALSIERKWLAVARCTERIDRTTATDAINAVYLAIGSKKVPEIIFVDSPNAALKMLQAKNEYEKNSSFSIFRRLKIDLVIRPRNSIQHQLRNLPQTDTEQNEPKFISHSWSMAQIQLFSRVSIQFWSRYAWFLDFAYSVLGCDYVPEKWEALQLLVKNCGYIQPFNNICFVSDRPTELLFKDDFILHAENRPAVVFRDGYQIFANNGVELSISF